MSNIFKCDLYRFGKSKLLYGIAAFTAFIALSLTLMIRQDIRLGVSISGDVGFMFRNIDDVIRTGLQHHKLLGIFVAILLSVFIGQEYQWKTWQHKWITNKSRTRIYLSKAIFSAVGAVAIFLIYQFIVLIFGGQMREMLTGAYFATVISGMFIYAALGAVICLFSMLIKNNTASTIICLCYVMFSETIASLLGNVNNFSSTLGRFVGFSIKHSVFGMSAIASSPDFTIAHTAPIIINALAIILLSTAFGMTVFRRYEL